MKSKASNRKLRYGGVTAIMTTLIIAVIIVVNVIFSALGQKKSWLHPDLTPELLFTLSDNCVDLLENGDSTFENSSSATKMVDKYREERRAADPNFKDEDLMIDIIFCNDRDAWIESTAQRYVYETAMQLQEEFPEYIKVSNVNIVWNPSAVSKYHGTVSPTSVIIEFGSEYRVRSIRDFYVFNETSDEEPWAFNAEKIMASAILAVTRADSPIACFTTGHDEALQDTQLALTLEIAGFEVRSVDLRNEEIPENCRLIVVFDPRSDFLVASGRSEIDEIKKLETFLDGTNSMMVFMSPEVTEPLTEFEAFLAEWGISYNRLEEGGTYHPHIIRDLSQSISVDGYTVEAEYYTEGLGGSMTEDLRSRSATPPMMVFPNAMTISYSEEFTPQHYTDEEDDSIQFDYATRGVDGHYRSIYDVFVSSENAVAMANGREVAKATALNPLKLMTVSVEDRTTQESNYTSVNEASYVIACGSTEFASADLLLRSYGNGSFLEYALRIIGQEPVPVGLTFKPFGDTTIDTVTTAEATQYTVVLTAAPALICLVTGIVIIVRRKHR